jgi:hypothetical protein
MKIRALVAIVVVTAMSSLSVTATANAQFVITKSVIASGGGIMTSGNFTLNGTVGQAVVGKTTSGSFDVFQGFWTPGMTGPLAVARGAGQATGYDLAQNFPNPFNPSTTIRFSVPERTKVTLRVMNLLGEEVARIIDNESYDAGTWEVPYLAKDIPSGTYVYRLEAGNIVKTRKMVLMK